MIGETHEEVHRYTVNRWVLQIAKKTRPGEEPVYYILLTSHHLHRRNHYFEPVRDSRGIIRWPYFVPDYVRRRVEKMYREHADLLNSQ